MSVSMTARKIVSSSGMVKNWGGWKIPPLRATSIIPLEKVTPAKMPRVAMIRITVLGATREPIEGGVRKFTASLLTPTMMSKMAIMTRMTTPPIRRNSMLIFAIVLSILFDKISRQLV